MAPATVSASLATKTTPSVLPFEITSTFTAPAECAQATGGLTMLQADQYRVWLNAILPVPGSTFTSCYPSQFASSFLLQSGGVSQEPFSPLVCPSGYTTQGPFTSNYIACCPSGWDGLALAAGAPPDRPAFGGTCYSNIYDVPVTITFYDNTALKATSIFTATDTNAQAFAYPYEGTALGVAIVKSITNSESSSTKSTEPTFAVSSDPTPSSASQSSSLSPGAKAGIALAALFGAAFFILSAYLILRHRRKNLSKYNNMPPTASTDDPNAATTGYFTFEPKKDIPPEELYGSQEVKNHGETQELDTSRTVHEMGDESEYAGSARDRDQKRPSMPSPLSSPRTPVPPYPGT